MTVLEVAYEANMSIPTVYRMIERGELPALRINGRRIRVVRSEFERWLASATRRS